MLNHLQEHKTISFNEKRKKRKEKHHIFHSVYMSTNLILKGGDHESWK